MDGQCQLHVRAVLSLPPLVVIWVVYLLSLLGRIAIKHLFVCYIGDGYCFRSIALFISVFLCLFLCQQDYENGRTDLHETFREDVEWPRDDLITFLVNSEKQRDAAMRNTGVGFVVLSHHSLFVCWLVRSFVRYVPSDFSKVKVRLSRNCAQMMFSICAKGQGQGQGSRSFVSYTTNPPRPRRNHWPVNIRALAQVGHVNLSR